MPDTPDAACLAETLNERINAELTSFVGAINDHTAREFLKNRMSRCVADIMDDLIDFRPSFAVETSTDPRMQSITLIPKNFATALAMNGIVAPAQALVDNVCTVGGCEYHWDAENHQLSSH